MYEILSRLLSDKDNGVFVFRAFSLCHIIYILLIAAAITLTIFYCKNKSQEIKNKVINITVILALCLYITDFFLMPFSYGYIDIDKLPFHLCTSMSIMCVLARNIKCLSKFKTSFTIMGLIGALMYLSYPAGVAEADGYSYRIIQTVIYHGLMVAQGIFAIAFNDLDLSLRNLKYDAFSVLGLTIWAFIGNTLYSGVVTETCNCVEGCTQTITTYSHDFNWFFVKHDALYVFSDEIDIYFAPFMMIAIVFGMCSIIRLISIKIINLTISKTTIKNQI